MSPDSEEEFQLGLNPSSHLHQPFKQEVAEGMDSTYAPWLFFFLSNILF